MKSNLETTVFVTVTLVVGLLGIAGTAWAQGADPAPNPSVPGITVTPSWQPRRPVPQPLVPDSRDGATRQSPQNGEPQRVHPHGGCQYEQQPLELIV